MRNLRVLFLMAGLSLTLFSCGGDDNDEARVYNTTVALESVSRDGCLNVPTYFSGLQSLDPALPVIEITTDYSLKSNRPVREKFRDLMAYSTFRAGTRPLQEFVEFTSLSQQGCSELVFHSADGTAEIYPVTLSTPDSLRAEMEDGRSFQYTWVSPTQMIIDLSYHALDLPCGNETPVLIRQRRVLDWSQAPLESFDLGSEPFSVNESYLTKVANAVGVSAGALFDDGKINPAKLKEMAALPPRPELLACPGGGLPPPTNPDEEPEVPTDP